MIRTHRASSLSQTVRIRAKVALHRGLGAAQLVGDLVVRSSLRSFTAPRTPRREDPRAQKLNGSNTAVIVRHVPHRCQGIRNGPAIAPNPARSGLPATDEHFLAAMSGSQPAWALDG